MLLADYSGMRMRGTTYGGKAAAGATDIMGVSASGVKYFFHFDKQIGQIGKSISQNPLRKRISAQNSLYLPPACCILAGVQEDIFSSSSALARDCTSWLEKLDRGACTNFEQLEKPMPTRPSRNDAWTFLCEYTQNESLRKHALAVEACVRAYARKTGADEELWSLTALLHDFDYERWPNDAHSPTEEHPAGGSAILRERGYPEEMIRAIVTHADYCNVPEKRRSNIPYLPATNLPVSSPPAPSSNPGKASSRSSPIP